MCTSLKRTFDKCITVLRDTYFRCVMCVSIEKYIMSVIKYIFCSKADF